MPFDSVSSFPRVSTGVLSAPERPLVARRRVPTALTVTLVAIGLLVTTAVASSLAEHWLLTLAFLLAQATVVSIVIWQACEPFAEAAQWLGHRLRVPGSVRGATLDAVASSMPELFAGVFFVAVTFTASSAGGSGSVVSGHGYGAALATCAGSAVYNMILIPAICALVIARSRPETPHIEVSKEILTRDGLWFLGCELLLVAFLFQPVLHWWMAAALIALYVVYVGVLYRQTLRFRLLDESAPGNDDEDDAPDAVTLPFEVGAIPLSLRTAWSVIVVSTLVAAAACYWLVEITHTTASTLEVPTFFVAVILAAAASSVPDTFLSIGSARHGDDDGAVANAFGSNIFDLCICLSVPMLLAIGLNGGQPIALTENGEPLPGLVGIRMMLVGLTVATLALLWHQKRLTRNKALVLCGFYFAFIAFAVFGSLSS